MCKFCKGKHKAIIADLKVYKDRTVTVTSAIVNGNTLKFLQLCKADILSDSFR